MGFYSACPGDGIYILGSPLFSRVTLNLDEKWYKGAKFTITAENQAPDHPYVQSAKLNGKPLSRAWIRHSEIAAGGVLEFIMGAESNKQWATRTEDLPPSWSALADRT
jgi:putative alpha-1,2-mannosidase